VLNYECLRADHEGPRKESIKCDKEIEKKEDTMRLNKKTLIGAGLVAAVMALMLLSGSAVLAAGNQPPLNVNVTNTPAVNVVNTPAAPAQVQVLNDALYLPYIRQFDTQTPSPFGGAYELTFPIPGTVFQTRLVIETVSVEAQVPAGQKVRVFLNVADQIIDGQPNYHLLGPLDVKSLGSFGGAEYYVASQPFKARVDYILEGTPQIQVRMLRDSTTGSASLTATIYGYLVDLP
jgi:hypothetical protein